MSGHQEQSRGWEPNIGLQVRVPLVTATKMFCGCANRSGAAPNTLICPVCLGIPESASILNSESIAKALKLGIALNCRAASSVIFDRKHTTFEGSPKGYRITQVNHPLCYDGYLNILLNKSMQRITIKSLHLEENVAELLDLPTESFINFNSSGTPVAVLRTVDDFHSPEAVLMFLTRLTQLINYLEIADSIDNEVKVLCSASVSMRKFGRETAGPVTTLGEVKSCHELKTVLMDEIHRQSLVMEQAAEASADNTFAMTNPGPGELRHQYQPETDLPPILIPDDVLEMIRMEIRELPEDKEIRLVYRYGINRTQAEMIAADPDVADYFENLAMYSNPMDAVKWLLGAVFRAVTERKMNITEFPVSPGRLGELINHLKQKTITRSSARDVFKFMLDDPRSSTEIIVDKMLYIKEDYDKLFAVPQGKSSRHSIEEQSILDDQDIQDIYVGQMGRFSEKKSDT